MKKRQSNIRLFLSAVQKKRWSILLLCLITALVAVQPVFAQTYRFEVEESSVDLYANADGTVSLTYSYLFVNDAGADAIDYVDVGLPTSNYELYLITGTVDGKPITNIEESPYVDPGVALGLGDNAIQPGAKGLVQVTIPRVNGMLFNAKTEEAEAYASFQFSPNSFGSEYVNGDTRMTVTLHLPPGLESQEPRYFEPKNWPGSATPASSYDSEGRVIYQWTADNADSYTQYIFGAAFPARLVPETVLVTETPFTNFDLDAICPFLFICGFFGFMGFAIWGSVVSERKRKLKYLPPKISIEGNGIKRGLTPVEVGILNEQPMDRILTLALYSTVRKGALRVIERDPLKVEALPVANPDELQPYEKTFIEAMLSGGERERRRGLQEMMITLVRTVSEKMRGFSRKETQEYYKQIMEKAWQQVQAAGTPDVKMQAIEENMDWTMLDQRYNERSREVYGSGPVFLPTWWWRFDPGIPRGGMSHPFPTGPNQVGSAPSSINLPSLPGADFAASVANTVQSFSSNVVGDLTSFTSGVTNTTNPVPKTTSSGGGRSSGGGSCACACACAGCACACAGGGR